VSINQANHATLPIVEPVILFIKHQGEKKIRTSDRLVSVKNCTCLNDSFVIPFALSTVMRSSQKKTTTNTSKITLDVAMMVIISLLGWRRESSLNRCIIRVISQTGLVSFVVRISNFSLWFVWRYWRAFVSCGGTTALTGC